MSCIVVSLDSRNRLAVNLRETDGNMGSFTLFVTAHVRGNPHGPRTAPHLPRNGPAKQLAPEPMVIEIAVSIAQLIGDRGGDIDDAAQPDILPGEKGLRAGVAWSGRRRSAGTLRAERIDGRDEHVAGGFGPGTRRQINGQVA